jgi:hypothetical protein
MATFSGASLLRRRSATSAANYCLGTAAKPPSCRGQAARRFRRRGDTNRNGAESGA